MPAALLSFFFGTLVLAPAPLPPEYALELRDEHRMAQAPTALPDGVTQGTLNAGGATGSSGAPSVRWTFTARAGEAITLTARSTAFDTLLVLEGPGGYRVENDDAPGIGVNSRLRPVLPTAGEYTVLVTSPRSDARGAFTIALERGHGTPSATAASTAALPVLTDGATGRLAPGDATLRGGEFQDTWRLDVQAGDAFTIHMDSDEFDTYLFVRGPGGVSVDNDDRASGNTNSTVEVTFAAAGTATVVATSYRAGETGAYRLGLQRGARVDVAAQRLPAGEWQRGALASSDPTRPGGQHLHTWRFEGRRGDHVLLDLESDAFDTFLILRGPGGFHEENDDIDLGGGNLNSRVRAVLPADGEYRVEVTTYSAATVGAYRLRRTTDDLSAARVAEPTGDPTPAHAPGTELRGRLEAGDTQLRTGEFFDSHPIAGRAGQTVTVSMESLQFDTYLIVQGPNGYQQDNDDFGATTNSQLEITFPADGTYTVLATSYAAGQTGEYLLRIREGSVARANARGRVHAVVVGLSEYPASSPLPYCADDAEKLAQSLRSTGLLTQESRVLTDRNATRAAIQSAIADVARAATEEDVVIFFFSGHGDQQPNAAELNGFDETLEAWDGAILDDELARWLDPIRARLTVVALDSCFSGGFARDIVTRADRMGIFSSEEDVTSNVAMRFEAGGYLSLFLRDGLAGAADTDPADGVITVGELTQYLRRQWAQNMMSESVFTGDYETTWQNLVIDRGAVKVSDVVVYYDPR